MFLGLKGIHWDSDFIVEDNGIIVEWGIRIFSVVIATLMLQMLARLEGTRLSVSFIKLFVLFLISNVYLICFSL
jgi:hypothetical protein